MAVAVDANSNSGGTSWSHTCTGANRYLLVAWTIDSSTITSATYNGVAMTELTRYSAAGRVTVVWGLVAPATGANTVAITAGGSWGGGGAVSFTGVDQTTPSDTPTENTGSSSAMTVSVTSVAGNFVCGVGLAQSGGGTIGAGASETLEWERGVNGVSHLAMVTETGGASVSLDPTVSGGADWWIAGIDINQVTDTPPFGKVIDYTKFPKHKIAQRAQGVS